MPPTETDGRIESRVHWFSAVRQIDQSAQADR